MGLFQVRKVVEEDQGGSCWTTLASGSYNPNIDWTLTSPRFYSPIGSSLIITAVWMDW